MGTKVNSNYEDLITFTRASKGHALRPVSYGDELVTNGTFTSNINDWTNTNDVWVYDNGQARAQALGFEGATTALQQDISTTVNGLYELNIDISDAGGGYLLVLARDASNVNITNASTGNITAEGSYRFLFYAPTSTVKVTVFAYAGSTAAIDNVSVKEVLFDQPDGTLTLFEHPENVPRVEYDADGNRLGLLVEEQRTNLVTYSEDFTVQAGRWTNGQEGGASLTSGLTESPSMSDSVWKLYATSGTGTQLIQENVTVSGATDVVGSVYLKKAEYKYGGIRLLDSSQSAGYSVFIDLDDGSVFDTSTRGTPTVSDYSVQDVGNGWWRLSVITSSDGGEVNFTVAISDGTLINSFDVVSFVGDGTSGIYIYGAQVEEGSFPTSYMKNEGTTSGKDRSADVASIPVADFGWNTDIGSVVAEYNPLNVSDAINPVFELSSDSTNNRLYSLASTSRHWFVRSNAVTTADIDLGTPIESQQNKIAGAYKKDDFAASLNGGAVGTDTAGSMSVGIEDILIGSLHNNYYLNGHIKSIQYYPRRLSNAQLQDLTS